VPGTDRLSAIVEELRGRAPDWMSATALADRFDGPCELDLTRRDRSELAIHQRRPDPIMTNIEPRVSICVAAASRRNSL